MAISFLTGGDVAPIRSTGAGIFGDVAPLFRRANISFFNLELPLSERGEAAAGKAICHRGLPVNVEGLVEAGVTCVNLANNHILDFGVDAMFDTIALLEERAIGHFGAGPDIAAARIAHIADEGGIRVGFLGYTTTLPTGFAATPALPGVNPILAYVDSRSRTDTHESSTPVPRVASHADPVHLQGLRSDIRALRGAADVVIVYVHWGASMSPDVHDYQREIGRAAIESGAHGVFGGHQHVASGIEFYGGCPIVHGSGNLLFDTWPSFFTDETRKTFLFGATITRDGLRDCYALPASAGVHAPPRLLPRSDPMWNMICADLRERSRAFGTKIVARADSLEVRCA